MNLTLFFNRKNRWPEHYFSVWSLGNSLVSTIFFTIMNISFSSLRFDLLLIIAEELNQTGTKEFVLWLTLFSSFAVHSLRVVAMLFVIFW